MLFMEIYCNGLVLFIDIIYLVFFVVLSVVLFIVVFCV